MNDFLFTSESVSEGHPDKIADQISDAIVDAALVIDPNARVACECLVKTGVVILAGEISTTARLDYQSIVRKVINRIGYNHSKLGFDGNTCAIINLLGQQSIDIQRGIDNNNLLEQGAGDQGLVFGYATDESANLMPSAINYAHQLMIRHAQLRKNHHLPFLLPDAKSQVTLCYKNGLISSVDTIVLSSQHTENVTLHTLREAIIEEVIKPVIPLKLITGKTRFLINPTGRFVIGGPKADCGLTGRKIIVDTYGGVAHHGGGAFSGKDPSKVDRSAAYMARYLAKNIVAAGFAKKCEIQLAYAIGVAEPVSIMVNTFATETIPVNKIEQIIRDCFDLRPYSIIKLLDLLSPIYLLTACYGHFGRSIFPWEKLDSVKKLQSLI